MSSSLTNAQIEILKLFSTDLSDTEINVLRKMLIEFKYLQLQNALSDMNITSDVLKSWSEEHLRTSYSSQNSKFAEA
jgi:hypothetical protein